MKESENKVTDGWKEDDATREERGETRASISTPRKRDRQKERGGSRLNYEITKFRVKASSRKLLVGVN